MRFFNHPFRRFDHFIFRHTPKHLLCFDITPAISGTANLVRDLVWQQLLSYNDINIDNTDSINSKYKFAALLEINNIALGKQIPAYRLATLIANDIHEKIVAENSSLQESQQLLSDQNPLTVAKRIIKSTYIRRLQESINENQYSHQLWAKGAAQIVKENSIYIAKSKTHAASNVEDTAEHTVIVTINNQKIVMLANKHVEQNDVDNGETVIWFNNMEKNAFNVPIVMKKLENVTQLDVDNGGCELHADADTDTDPMAIKLRNNYDPRASMLNPPLPSSSKVTLE